MPAVLRVGKFYADKDDINNKRRKVGYGTGIHYTVDAEKDRQYYDKRQKEEDLSCKSKEDTFFWFAD